MTPDDIQQIRVLIREEVGEQLREHPTREELNRRFDDLWEHLDQRSREFDDIMRQQLTISAATNATLAALNVSVAALNTRLDAMNRRMEDFDIRLTDGGQ